MRWLTRRQHRAGSERGAVTALLTILVGTGVLLGTGAIVVDVGQLYSERTQLQNGADAAAIAVAQKCAISLTSCAAGVSSAPRYANLNASDGASAVDSVCGRSAIGGLTVCSGATGTLVTCPSLPSAGNFVDVHVSTKQANGSTLLPPTFAAHLAGNSAFTGSHVLACARATWGAPSKNTGLALTISLCEWLRATSTGTISKYVAQGPYPSPTPWPPAYTTGIAGTEQVLQLHGSGNTCSGSPSGFDLPGGFGWLTPDTGGTCITTVSAQGTVSENPGNSASSACQTALQTAYADSLHKPIYLPIYDGVKYSGNNGIYHIAGFAAFVVTGYRTPGNPSTQSMPSLISGTKYCTGSLNSCVYGFFTRALLPLGTTLSGSTDMGLLVVQLSG
ncbi:MAG: pilus assembly protein TadG-related protein [Jatrophihabitans sp.]|uniref:pilus assembly protein TadG-related protein n=1 Tax=Jatrophihabitans sp. TaxID=1932789 RepID=UPI003F7CFB8C